MDRQIIFFLLLTFNLRAQNLVINGGFEEYKKCPTAISQLEKAKGWKSPSKGTSDYYNSCSQNASINFSKKDGKIKVNPFDGFASAGFGIFVSDQSNRYEFIQSKLARKLEKGKDYCLIFYVFKSPTYYLNHCNFSILLSENKIKLSEWEFYSESQIQKNQFLTYNLNKNDFNWNKVCFFFTSNGNAEFVTIGFDKYLPITESKTKIKNKGDEGVYYYIDEISLTATSDLSQCNCTKESNYTEVVETDIIKGYNEAFYNQIVIKNLVFDVNKSQILEQSFKELKELASYLKNNPNYKIELIGHTDNIGSEEDNIKLSEARAKEVANYLIKEGVEAKRISYKGYGSEQPIKPNTSEENKLENRRVEFKLSKIN
ncbi:MAG: OmpA family protein [Bacteroidota bacterium]|nr:OmpA family protein [Bacteroidota bacterium]MDP3145996.1 OmpA family protein [Bacteroidota bacterium]